LKALVTGGAGFIGSNLVDALLARGDEVVVLDNLSTGRRSNLDSAIPRGARLVVENIRDGALVRSLLEDERPEVVFHLAAQVDVRRSVDDPSTDAHVNVGGTAAVLEAARLCGTPRAVLASTAGVYGDPEVLPTPEAAPVAPLSPYGASKAAAESYMELYRRLHGMSTLTLRMANVYGPRQDPHGEAGVVAIFSGVRADGRVATIYGDGRQTRDYVFVADVVNAFAAAGRSSAEGILNISTGVETSVSELAAAMQVPTESRPSRPGEVRRSCLSPRLAAEVLGWRARTALDEGLPQTLA
jgi:UDP-glucose 4-epimerase